MSVEGQLDIRLTLRDGAVAGVAIGSTRPLQLAEVFRGKSVDELLLLLPLMYSVCGTAQAAAAIDACEAALGQWPDCHTRAARHLLIDLETAREHLLRIQMDWPGFAGESPESSDPQALRQPLQWINRAAEALFGQTRPFQRGLTPRPRLEAVEHLLAELSEILAERVFAMPAEAWLGYHDRSDLQAWLSRGETLAARYLHQLGEQGWAGLGAIEPRYLPPAANDDFLRLLDGAQPEAVIARPSWQGQPCETTPLARQVGHPLLQQVIARHGSGLLARQLARLIELAGLPGRLQFLLNELQTPCDDSVGGRQQPFGLSVVEAARGRLLHRVVLDGERVSDYRILAPTEWNFHPQGALAQSLATLAANDPALLRDQAAQLINAIDPCVGYQLQLDGVA